MCFWRRDVDCLLANGKLVVWIACMFDKSEDIDLLAVSLVFICGILN